MRPFATTATATGALLLLTVAFASWSTRAELVVLGPWRATTWAALAAGLTCLAAGVLALQTLGTAPGLLRLAGLPLGLAAAIGLAGSALTWGFTLTDITYLGGDRTLVAERQCWHHCTTTVYEPAGAGYRPVGSLPLDAYDPFPDGAYRIEGPRLRFATAPGGQLNGELPLTPPPLPTASLR